MWDGVSQCHRKVELPLPIIYLIQPWAMSLSLEAACVFLKYYVMNNDIEHVICQCYRYSPRLKIMFYLLSIIWPIWGLVWKAALAGIGICLRIFFGAHLILKFLFLRCVKIKFRFLLSLSPFLNSDFFPVVFVIRERESLIQPNYGDHLRKCPVVWHCISGKSRFHNLMEKNTSLIW